MFAFVKHELESILDQFVISERHAALSRGSTLDARRDVFLGLPPNSLVPQGLRTVAGSLDSLQPGRLEFGAQEAGFPRVADSVFHAARDLPFDPEGPGPRHELTKDEFIGMS